MRTPFLPGDTPRSRTTLWRKASPWTKPPPPDPAAIATIAALHRQREETAALAQPRRPCPATKKGGHWLVQADGAGPYDPFRCQNEGCDYVFVPPGAGDYGMAKWPGTKGRSKAELQGMEAMT